MLRPSIQILCAVLLLIPIGATAAASTPADQPASADAAEILDRVRTVHAADRRLAAAELRLEGVRHGLSETHYRYSQWIGTERVFGAELIVSVGLDGEIRRHYVSLADPPRERLRRPGLIEELRQRHPEIVGRVSGRVSGWSNRNGVARPVERISVEDAPHLFTTWEIDAFTGELLSKIPSYVSSTGRVFPANPVTTLNDPSLRDGEDAAAVVPANAYQDVELLDLPAVGELSGPHVTIVDIDSPFTVRARVEEGLSFERDRDQFEEVNVYHHIDRSQRYMQSLGYTGARQVVPGGIRVDVHANRGADNSFFSATSSGPRILFGDGGVDDAEDPDIVLHEYGHAIHDSLSPGVLFGGSGTEARAVSEGFSDYWAFSSGFEASTFSGRDPFCVGDWDARCDGSSCSYPATADCLRRVDEELSIDDFSRSSSPGTEHENARIWSTFLRDLFVAMIARYGPEEGRHRTDTIVLESLQGLPMSPGFATIVSRMIDADVALYDARDVRTICTAARARGFSVPETCSVTQRGQTLFVPGGEVGTVFPDTTTALGVMLPSELVINGLMARVELETEAREDLQISLVAPDGTAVILHPFGSTAPATMVFGRDRLPAQPLDTLLGRANPGLWTLRLELRSGADPVALRDWGLYFELEGSDEIDIRGPVPGSRSIPAVAHTPGAENTFFVSDLAVTNPGPAHELLAIFTPAGTDGTGEFSAVRLAVPANGSVALNDIVHSLFDSSGAGALELRGALPAVRISSRTYNRAPAGTFGQTIPEASEIIVAGDRGLISQIRRTVRFRTNIGLADVSGRGSEVTIVVRDRNGLVVGSTTVGVEPFSLRQVSLGSFVTVPELVSGWAEISVTQVDDAVSAYSSVVDNLTGDSVFVPVTKEPSSERASAIPAAARVAGARGTRWRTDLWIVNGTGATESVTLTFHRTDGAVLTREVMLDPGSSRLHEDVVSALFESEGAGWIHVSPSRLILSSRTWNDDPSGSYGQYIGPVEIESSLAAGGMAIVPRVVMGADYRSNVGMTELTGAPASMRLDVRDREGVLRCSMNVTVGGNQHRQWSVADLGCGSIAGGRVEIHHLGGPGRIAGYVSIVDQYSGDPSFIPAH